MSKPITEDQVVQELQQDKNLEENYRRLYELYYRRLVYYFGRQEATHEESRDLAQETFLAVIKGIKEFRGESSFKTWILRIAYNTLSNYKRREAATKRIPATISLDSLPNPPCSADTFFEDAADPGPESRYFSKEGAQRLREEIWRLPPQMRNCVILRICQDRKYREIAIVLDISLQAVRSHLYQAKSKLKEKLGEYVDTINLEEGDDDG